jgi:hypothetical protein
MYDVLFLCRSFAIMCTFLKNKLVFRIKSFEISIMSFHNINASNIRDMLIIHHLTLNIITWVSSTKSWWCLILNFFHIVSCLTVSRDMLLEWFLHSHNKIRGQGSDQWRSQLPSQGLDRWRLLRSDLPGHAHLGGAPMARSKKVICGPGPGHMEDTSLLPHGWSMSTPPWRL